MHDLIIIGGGPGGIAAGIYAARKKIKTALITQDFGGQSVVSADIQNWIGTKSISGFDFAKALEEHLKAQEGIDIFEGERVSMINKSGEGFTVTTEKGTLFETKTILITSGSRRRKLNVPGEAKLDGKGVAYCATCDAPLFKNKIVAVVGGGNAGLESVVDLLKYASKVYLIEYGETVKGDPVTFEKIKTDPKVEVRVNTKTIEITGENFVTGLKFSNLKDGTSGEIPLQGVFVEIGSVPNTDFLKELVQLNKFGEVVVDHKTQQSSLLGIWSAGDASDVIYKQNNISAGDAIKAVLNIHDYLSKK